MVDQTSGNGGLPALADTDGGEVALPGERYRLFAAASLSASTLRAYQKEWRAFVTWCIEHGFESLPAGPEVVARWLSDHADRRKPSGLDLGLAAIAFVHKETGHPNPRKTNLVARVRAGIRRTKGVRPSKKAPLVVEDLAAMLRETPNDKVGRRDRTILLLGFGAALRRSEIAALDVEDVSVETDGLRVVLRRSKTDQEGAGRVVAIGKGRRPELCPVSAWEAWREVAGTTEGPAFHSARGRLTDRAIANVVKRAAARAGIDPKTVSGHSLRSGLVTSAARAGVSEADIARTTGHRSVAVLRGYVQEANLFARNPAGAVL